MRRKLPLIIVPLAVLLAVLLVSQDDTPVAGTVAIAAGGRPVSPAGMRLYVDPDTGEFVETPSEAAPVEMAQDEMGQFSTSTAGLFEEEAPGGGIMVNLQGRFQQAYVAVIDESGNLSAGCGHVHPIARTTANVEKEGE